MTDFRDSTPGFDPALSSLGFVPASDHRSFVSVYRGPIPYAQPGTMMAAIVALESQRDFTRAKQVRALLKDAL